MRHTVLGLVAGFCFIASAHAALVNAQGASDHEVVSRFAGSTLIAREDKNFDAATIPTDANGGTQRLEGRITRLFYLSPKGKSLLEVQRNYEQALSKAGAVMRDNCSANCGARAFSTINSQPTGVAYAKGDVEGWSAETILQMWQDKASTHYWYGTLPTASGTTRHIAVLSAKAGVMALAENYVTTVIEIIEPQAMQTGQVTADANAISKGLQAEGKMALYGIYFDTGKATLKPESNAQLAEMLSVIKANPALKMFIVGHTDNQGSIATNLALSKARAEAVVASLVASGAKAGQLSAAGVANYAPVASNANDAGRAKNRRVEMVLQ